MKQLWKLLLVVLLVFALSIPAGAMASGYVEQEDGPSLLIALVIGLVAAGITLGILCWKMNTSRRQHSAHHYLVPGSYRLRTQQDIYLYSSVSKTPKPKDTGRGGRHGGGRNF